MKSDGFPTYHLAVVVDDYLMEISHVMRGEEWISSTPKHVLLYQAFGWEKPIYAHIPVFLNPDGQGKMSKRKGTVSAQSFLDDGYLPEAMLNFFMILGWAREDEREIMSLDEYIQEFDPSRISAKSVVFDLKKLAWVNGQYIRKVSLDQLLEKLEPHIPSDFPREKLAAVVLLIHDRLEKLSQFDELTTFFYKAFALDEEFQNALIKKVTPQLLSDQLELTHAALQNISDWSIKTLEVVIRELQEKHAWKKNQYFMMLRVAVTGRKATPPLFETMEVIGQEIVLDRIIAAQRLGKTW
jgi:glutamyl-tRNA synthetase